ncbi:MAG: sugar-binding domain-containing protein [Thermotaleaceae bacterium]
MREDIDLDKLLELQKKIVPEMIETLIERYNILRLIYFNQPIGRRNLSAALGMGERVIRGEVNFLKEQGFIEIKAEGMNTTELGENTLEVLKGFIHRFKGLTRIEKHIQKRLQIKKAIVVSGNVNEDPMVLREIGKAASAYLKTLLHANTVIGVTGGQTMALIADEMSDDPIPKSNMTIIPARGGLGKDVEKQANTIAANLAKKLGASYKLLYMPDHISKDVLTSLYEDPHIKEAMDYIQKIDILLFGIGRADRMAHRRGLSKEKIGELLENGAVAEAFGYYFNKNGEIIEEINTAGVSLERYKELKDVIGAATGVEKTEAVIAISKLNPNLVLVIDEGLAKEILK